MMTAKDPPVDSARQEVELEQARALVLKEGWGATAYQIINPGISLWFSSERTGVAGYVDYGRFRIVAGAPVMTGTMILPTLLELEKEATGQGKKVCFFGVEEWFREVSGTLPGHNAVLLGAQPAWDPAIWPGILEHRASLRAQLNRALNKDVEVHEWPVDSAETHPQLHQCLEEWLATRGLPPMHFLVEPETLTFLQGRRLFVARRHREVVGFLVASPVARRHGWLIEQIVRGKGAVNGTSELLIDAAFSTFAREGWSYVTLGLAALSRRAEFSLQINPWWLRFVFGWVRAHGCRFYNFEGLDAFKAKFNPQTWEPIYAVTNQSRFTFSALYAVAGAFSAGSPVSLVSRALYKGVRTESSWMWDWLCGRVSR